MISCIYPLHEKGSIINHHYPQEIWHGLHLEKPRSLKPPPPPRPHSLPLPSRRQAAEEYGCVVGCEYGEMNASEHSSIGVVVWL